MKYEQEDGGNLPFQHVRIASMDGRLGLAIEDSDADKAILSFEDVEGQITSIGEINADELRDESDIFLELADRLDERDESDE